MPSVDPPPSQEEIMVGAELVDHLVLRGHHGQAMSDRQHPQGGDNGDPDIGDQDAVDQSDRQRGGEPGGNADPGRVAVMQHDR
jgi:hypothetical protein